MVRKPKTYTARRMIKGESRMCYITIDEHGKEHRTLVNPKNVESYGNGWTRVYVDGRPAMQHRGDGRIKFPSAAYLRTHPRNPWVSQH